MCQNGPPRLTCVNGDGCCPSGCTGQDTDCGSPTTTFYAVDRGWWNSDGTHDATNKNTYTGWLYPNFYNSYFVFDLRGFSAVATSATLVLEMETYFGTDPSESASVWDVTTATDRLEASGRDVAVFDDLASGTAYGRFTSSNQSGQQISIPLNQAAVMAINAGRNTTLAVGVHIDTLAAVHSGDEGLRFSQASEPRVHQLIVQTQ
jgi:hypothetical protein